MITIRHAKKADLDEIVNVHQSSFKGFFLTLLGRRFLAKLYLAFITQPSGIVLVAENADAHVIGFAAGTSAPEHYFMELRQRSWLGFLLAAIPGICRHPVRVIKKLYYAMFYKGDKPAQLNSAALLSSIAVEPCYAGKAYGRQLLSRFEEAMRQRSIEVIYLTTDKHGNDGVVKFYQSAGYKVGSEFTQPDGREMLRLVKDI